MPLSNVTRVGVALLAVAMISVGCSTNDSEKPNVSTGSAAEQTNDFQDIGRVLDSAGWSTEAEFDWSELGTADGQPPEVNNVLPTMSTWVRSSIFSEEVNDATSTLEVLKSSQRLVGAREYDNWVKRYKDDPGGGLENAAAYGLVISPSAKLSADPRIAVSTEVNESDNEDTAAVIDMTARAAIPLSDGSTSRWGVYVYHLEFTVPEGYEIGGDWWSGTSVSSKSLGLVTCDWAKNYSADVAEDGMYDPALVREGIEFAAPEDNFSWNDFEEGIGRNPNPTNVCKQ